MSAPHKLLVVEDDRNLGTLLVEYLRAKGYDADLRSDGHEGKAAYDKGGYDLLILDVMMPLKDGFTLAREIRQRDATTPIIFLTAKAMKQDAVQGFQNGADDYMTKPFSMEELLLRVSAVLRRSKGVEPKAPEPEEYLIGDTGFQPRKQLLRTPDGERKLTTKENELLRLLCMNRNEVLDRSEALMAVWGDDSYFNGRSMDVYIAKLRKYLRADTKVEIINVHGKGFRLIAEPGPS
ncbi:MAG: response regulator transcription factor [Flavobacteriales bacterium]|jgi:DNA-binding response OmpR family regulator|nr:response regulator transcription factor [Flavobacteriales bacterium]